MVSGQDETARLAALRRYAILDTDPEASFDEIAQIAAHVCGTPIAFISFIDETRQWFKARHGGFSVAETARSIAFCAHTVIARDIVVVDDAAEDPRFSTNPLVTAIPGIRFYAGAPLIVSSGDAIGTLAVIDFQPRTLDAGQRSALVALAHQVVTLLELRRLLAEQQQLRREGSQRLALFARVTNDAVYDWEFATNHIWWNEGMRTLFGYPPDQVPTLDSWSASIHPEDVARITDGLHAAIARGAALWEDTYRFKRHDGTHADILDRGYIVRDASGAPERMIGAMLDVTERRKLEDQLRQAQKLEAIGQLSGGVAHDFNNLLTVIQVNAALLGRALHDQGLREHTQAITEATDRAATLTRQLLMMSRKQIMQQRVIDLNEVVTSLLRMLHRVVGEDVTFVTRTETRVPPVFADVGMLEQVLLNLVVNARDAMPRGGVLTIATDHMQLATPRRVHGFEAAAGPFTSVSVSDTGTGIESADLPRIFDPFFTTKDVGRGTGLGLATVYGIIRQHRGWIDVQTGLGQGTTFIVYLPVTEGRPQRLASSPPLEDDLPTGTETILVVEDEQALQRLVVALLESCGYTVHGAGSGAEALGVWRTHAASIDLVLTDIVMPGGMNGRELADRLRGEVSDLPVVFTSGYSTVPVTTEEALVEGDNFIAKPYQPLTLAVTVRRRLDRAPRQR